MVLIPDLCLMADDSIYIQNIYSGKVTTLSHKEATDLQYYYRRSNTPSNDNEYIYDYTYDRVESILRLIVGKYKRNKILNLKHIHEYELSYEFYEQYCPRIISFQNISIDIMERVMTNKKLSIEFWLDKIVEFSDFSNNRAYYFDMVSALFQYSPYVKELYDRYRKLHSYDTYYIHHGIDIIYNITKNRNLDVELFEKTLEININQLHDADTFIKSLCECNISDPVLFKKHKDRILEISGASEYMFYSHLVSANIDIDDIVSYMERDYMNRGERRDFVDIHRHILTKDINYDICQLPAILTKLSNICDVNESECIVFIFENKLLSREIIKSIIIPEIILLRQQHRIDIYSYTGIIVTHPNIYREDLVSMGIDIYECQPDYLLSNPNINISNKEIFDNIMFNTDYDFVTSTEFMSYPQIMESDIIYFIDRYIADYVIENSKYYRDYTGDIFKWMARNPNLTEYALSLIINASQIDEDISRHKIHVIDWPAVFSNPNISIKYIEKLFRKHPDLFA